MKRKFSSLLPVSLLYLTASFAAETENTLQLRAHRINSNVQIDGLLAESYWQTAPFATGFRQNQPREGEPATEKTEVRVMYDEQNLYVGVMCFDREPHKIVAQKLQRDGGLDDDDMFAFLLDTYHDKRNAYFFATNPNGAEQDGQLVDGAYEADLDWDGVWEVRAKVHEQGWSAEFKIPLWNFKFNSLAEQSWGINFTRIIKRKTEQANWASWSRDNLGGFLRVSRAGDLLDLQELRPGRNLQVKPYGLGKSSRDNLLTASPRKVEKLDAGLDVKYGVTSNLTLDLTANTDFAQVEADVEQVNLTRFPLFFPEKREFFLESANTFQFGEQNFFGPPPIQLFYSRRIGIQGFGEIVPIIAGGRLTGKVGKYELGLLDMLTDEKAGAPRSHFSVVRVNRDVSQRSKIGVMFTNRANLGRNHEQAYGADANLWLSNPMVFQSFFAQTHASSSGATKTAWKLGLDFTKDHWGWFASHMAIDKGFDPGVGFVLRSDIRRSFATFRVSPQPNGSFLRRSNIFQNVTHLTNIKGRVQDWDYRLTFFNELANGDNLNFGYGRIFERLELEDPNALYPFREYLRIPQGDYYNHLLQINYQSSAKRKLTVFGNAYWREFYDGELRNFGGGFGFRPNAHWSFGLNYDRNQVDLPQGELNTDLFELRGNFAFNTRLFLDALLQYNSETNELSTNLRLNFIHTPGSDLFFVYNESRGREGEDFSDGLPARNREAILKFTRLLRF
ncbi:carbohydrate binding family 9 domain-containing protein [candidate division KSB1 bacterium]|nr:carbohydrate binding family 9 domain-containing protein [candidate division KSB1 bacterium]